MKQNWRKNKNSWKKVGYFLHERGTQQAERLVYKIIHLKSISFNKVNAK